MSSCVMPGGMAWTSNGPAVTTTSRRAGSRRTAATGSEWTGGGGGGRSENNITTGVMRTPNGFVKAIGGRASPEKLSRGLCGYNRPAVLGPSLGLALAVAAAAPAAAQAERIIFPDAARRFEYPLASPRASAMVGRIIRVSRGESAFGAEWEAEPALGEIWPLLSLSRGPVPVTLHLGTEVYGRFSLHDKSNALISNDWNVNAVVTVEGRHWRWALEGYHESSHLGDEYHDHFPAVGRVNWSREIVGLWAGYVVGDVQLRGNVSYAAIDAVNVGRGGAALAVDYIGHRGGLLGKYLAPVFAGWADGP